MVKICIGASNVGRDEVCVACVVGLRGFLLIFLNLSSCSWYSYSLVMYVVSCEI